MSDDAAIACGFSPVPPNSDSDMSNQVTMFLYCMNAVSTNIGLGCTMKPGGIGMIQEGIVQGDENERNLKWLTALAFLSGPLVANAQLLAVDGGALLNDPTAKLTWVGTAISSPRRPRGAATPGSSCRRSSKHRAA